MPPRKKSTKKTTTKKTTTKKAEKTITDKTKEEEDIELAFDDSDKKQESKWKKASREFMKNIKKPPKYDEKGIDFNDETEDTEKRDEAYQA